MLIKTEMKFSYPWFGISARDPLYDPHIKTGADDYSWAPD